MNVTADELASRAALFGETRRELGRAGEPGDVAVLGVAESSGGVAAYAQAGATWWLESLSPMRGSLDELESVVRAGPPI